MRDYLILFKQSQSSLLVFDTLVFLLNNAYIYIIYYDDVVMIFHKYKYYFTVLLVLDIIYNSLEI
jgi:hypothetical protein